ncbi:hypothetical protein HanRHA438_Chr17g0799251 [Helianthus annuus]|nr:hypothetical protein HanRHA438_Chr17g0799251 [Helianthus annuus]
MLKCCYIIIISYANILGLLYISYWAYYISGPVCYNGLLSLLVGVMGRGLIC